MEIKLDIDNYEKKFSVTNGKVKEEYKFEDVNDLIENLEEYIRLNMLELDCEFQYSLTDGQEFFVPQNGDDYIIIKENGETRQCFTVVTGAEEDMLGPLSNNEVAFENVIEIQTEKLPSWLQEINIETKVPIATPIRLYLRTNKIEIIILTIGSIIENTFVSLKCPLANTSVEYGYLII